jgi:hypothetical protein
VSRYSKILDFRVSEVVLIRVDLVLVGAFRRVQDVGEAVPHQEALVLRRVPETGGSTGGRRAGGAHLSPRYSPGVMRLTSCASDSLLSWFVVTVMLIPLSRSSKYSPVITSSDFGRKVPYDTDITKLSRVKAPLTL